MAEVVTGEAVVLDLTVARFPSRLLALLIDIAVQIPALVFIAVVVTVSGAGHLNSASAAAIYISGLMLVLVGYPLIFETVSRGKTLGKMALGLRVVSDDGGPERFRQALIRALSEAFIEIWLPPFNIIGLPAGLITSMVSAKGKRLGDVFAGTFVIQERVPRGRNWPRPSRWCRRRWPAGPGTWSCPGCPTRRRPPRAATCAGITTCAPRPASNSACSSPPPWRPRSARRPRRARTRPRTCPPCSRSAATASRPGSPLAGRPRRPRPVTDPKPAPALMLAPALKLTPDHKLTPGRTLAPDPKLADPRHPSRAPGRSRSGRTNWSR